VLDIAEGSASLRAIFERAHVTRVCIVPLVARGEFYGVVTAPVADGPIRSDLWERLQGVANQGATALQNATLVEQIRHQALHDVLTGMPNRLLFEDRLAQALATTRREGGQVAVLFVDLDGFKKVNDTHGHACGDELLKQAARRLVGAVRATDTVARIGGDEFAIILENLRPDDEGPRQVAEKIVASLALPIDALGHSLVTSCSVGIAVYPADARGAAEITKAADVAMYHAKEQGRNNYQFFAAGMNVRAQERLALESYLRLAVKRQELALHYQPRVRMADGQLVAVEALLRWRHPRRGLLGPEAFLEIAAESGLIVPKPAGSSPRGAAPSSRGCACRSTCAKRSSRRASGCTRRWTRRCATRRSTPTRSRSRSARPTSSTPSTSAPPRCSGSRRSASASCSTISAPAMRRSRASMRCRCRRSRSTPGDRAPRPASAPRAPRSRWRTRSASR
jgi:diguanylate cyclase (GGDEF)-like protein